MPPVRRRGGGVVIQIGQPECLDCDARMEWLAGQWVCFVCFLNPGRRS
jgi:hypothetical protein